MGNSIIILFNIKCILRTDGEGEEIVFRVHDGQMFPLELFANCVENEFKATLAIRESRQGWVVGLVAKYAL